jgi:hypothetical protein
MTKFNKNTNFEIIRKERYHEISSLEKKCYDKDQRALFGNCVHTATIYYNYIPAEHMEENVPFIVSSTVRYDGGKEQAIAVTEGALVVNFEELKNIFTNNKFS